MKNLFALLFFIASSIIVNAQQNKWELDEDHSSINFSISHLLISQISGSLDEFDIKAIADDDFQNPSFEVNIKTASINTKNKMRDEHLREDDFFGVKKHPKITYKSTTYEKTGDKTFKVKGNLTIKGITKETVFDGRLNGILKEEEERIAGLKLTTTIMRAEFGIGEEGGSIGDEVEVTINLEMIKPN